MNVKEVTFIRAVTAELDVITPSNSFTGTMLFTDPRACTPRRYLMLTGKCKVSNFRFLGRLNETSNEISFKRRVNKPEPPNFPLLLTEVILKSLWPSFIIIAYVYTPLPSRVRKDGEGVRSLL